MKKKSLLFKTAAATLTLLSLILLSACNAKNWAEGTGTWCYRSFFADNPYQEIELFYGTDRDSTGRTEPCNYFSNKNGDLSWGACTVAIPFEKDKGKLKSSNFTMTTFGTREAGDYEVIDVRPIPLRAFETTLSKRLANNPSKSVSIFVHGYNISFEEAALRTARMTYQLQYHGAPLFFSWPANGGKLDYLHDEQAADLSVQKLRKFIREVAENSGAEKIYLVGNNMGCLPLCEALTGLELIPEDMEKISDLILIAPDINRNKFAKTILPRLNKMNSLITVYTSDRDQALAQAHRERVGARLGDTTGHVEMPGIDFVDASDVDTSMTGRSYFVKRAPIYSDLATVIDNP